MSELNSVVSFFVALIFSAGVYFQYNDFSKCDGTNFARNAKISTGVLFLFSLGCVLTGNFDLINKSLIS
jgi:hypothetical protein